MRRIVGICLTMRQDLITEGQDSAKHRTICAMCITMIGSTMKQEDKLGSMHITSQPHSRKISAHCIGLFSLTVCVYLQMTRTHMTTMAITTMPTKVHNQILAAERPCKLSNGQWTPGQVAVCSPLQWGPLECHCLEVPRTKSSYCSPEINSQTPVWQWRTSTIFMDTDSKPTLRSCIGAE